MPVAWSVMTKSIAIGSSRSRSTPGTLDCTEAAGGIVLLAVDRHDQAVNPSALHVFDRLGFAPRLATGVDQVQGVTAFAELGLRRLEHCGVERIGDVVDDEADGNVLRRRMFWARGSGWKPSRSITVLELFEVTGRDRSPARSASVKRFRRRRRRPPRRRGS